MPETGSNSDFFIVWFWTIATSGGKRTPPHSTFYLRPQLEFGCLCQSQLIILAYFLLRHTHSVYMCVCVYLCVCADHWHYRQHKMSVLICLWFVFCLFYLFIVERRGSQGNCLLFAGGNLGKDLPFVNITTIIPIIIVAP